MKQAVRRYSIEFLIIRRLKKRLLDFHSLFQLNIQINLNIGNSQFGIFELKIFDILKTQKIGKK